MKRQLITCLSATFILAVSGSDLPAAAEPGTCHMEKQCKWVNFKKVCVWTRVCH